jgi:hypothetical protein
MMKRMIFGLAAALAVMGLSGMPAPTEARGIACRDGYQNVGGNEISTPYCQDELLAQVARSYGMKAPADKIRYNPNFKREVCRFVGHDIRVQQNCINDAPGNRVPAR